MTEFIEYSYPLLSGVCSMLIAQSLKMIYFYYKNHEFNFFTLFSAGGMPSTHSSLVIGLATAVGISQGFLSHYFAICTILSMVVLYDAVGIRRVIGVQAKMLNQLIDQGVIKNCEKVKEYVGHSPAEITIGSLIGISTAVMLYNWLS